MRELIAAHRLKAGEHEKAPVLHVALAPAQIAADEFDQGRRVFLPAQVLFRQHAHVVAGGAHQRGLDLIVAEDVAAGHSVFGQDRKLAMRDERLEPQHRVMAPIGTAIALPPGAADGVGAHAEPHAELKEAREGAGRRQADDEPLQNAELGIRLHDAHETQDGVGGHEAVGVERHGEFVLRCPSARRNRECCRPCSRY